MHYSSLGNFPRMCQILEVPGVVRWGHRSPPYTPEGNGSMRSQFKSQGTWRIIS